MITDAATMPSAAVHDLLGHPFAVLCRNWWSECACCCSKGRRSTAASPHTSSTGSSYSDGTCGSDHAVMITQSDEPCLQRASITSVCKAVIGYKPVRKGRNRVGVRAASATPGLLFPEGIHPLRRTPWVSPRVLTYADAASADLVHGPACRGLARLSGSVLRPDLGDHPPGG